MIKNSRVLTGIALILAVFTMPCDAAPELLRPRNDARFGKGDAMVVFEWQDAVNTEFEIEFGLDPQFELGTGPIDVGKTTIYDLGELVPEELWEPVTALLYWRVRGRPTGSSVDEWSQTFCFHKLTLEKLVVYHGKDGRYTHQLPMPYFSWSNPDGLNWFSMEFSMQADFDSPFGRLILDEPEFDLSDVDRTDWDPFEIVLYWRVSAETDTGTTGPWSDICRLSKTLIQPPKIIGPKDGAVFEPDSSPPILEWEPLGENEDYQIRLYADDNGDVEIITLNHSGSTRYDFGADLGISDEDWHYAPLSLFWSVAGHDDEGRPGPFGRPFELIKPGLQRVAGYGDSITEGKCFDNGYLDILQERLELLWGSRTSTVNIALGGMKSKWGAENINGRLQACNPQYVLIMFGTNDSVDPGNCDPPMYCNVGGNMAEMVSIARDRGTIPIVSTIIPVNPEGHLAAAQHEIDANNRDIVEMAMQMGVELVDLDAMFKEYGHLPDLFCDWGHPNEEGYHIMAQGFYDGIVRSSRR